MNRFKVLLRFLLLAGLTLIALTVLAQEDDQVSSTFLAGNGSIHANPSPHAHANGQAHARFGIPNIDSLVNFNGHFFDANGVDANDNLQHEWYINTVGNPPAIPGTTMINAPIVPVTLDLRNFDGSPRFVNGRRLISRPDAFVQPVLNSPVFQNATYSSSPVPTQFTDAVQRAEFSNAHPSWHTLLNPSVKTGRTMVLIRGTYRFALNPDGSCCFFVLIDINTFVNALFPAVASDTTTPIGAAENAGDITTHDMSTFLFNNAYLYFNNNPSHCCVLGFHTYDFEPGTPDNGNLEKRYVVNYSSWTSPGIFNSPSFLDVTALSHEIAETYNDPFVASDGIHNITPVWLAPNGNCQNSRETGDVIEGLPNATFPMTMNGFTYHPQNEALLQWFEFESPSSALGGVYSYPDPTALPALSPAHGCLP